MLMNSLFLCGRHDLAKNLLDALLEDVAKRISMIRSCTTEADGSGGTCVSERSKTGGVEMDILIVTATWCWVRALRAKTCEVLWSGCRK